MSRFNFEPILENYSLVLLLAATLLVLLWIIRPRTEGAIDQRRRAILLVLRSAVVLLLLLAMLRPAYVSTISEPQQATVVVLLDASRSMQVEDIAGGNSRWQTLKEAVRRCQPIVAELAENVEFRFYTFDRQTTLVPTEPRQLPALPEKASGTETDIGGALADALQREAGKRLAAVVLISDGAQRSFQFRADVQQSVRELGRRGVPLLTVPLGMPREQSSARDVAVEQFPQQFVVFVRNELVLRGALRIQGYVHKPIPLRLQVTLPDGNETTLGPQDVTANDAIVSFQFRFIPEQPGDYRLVLQAEPQPGELVVNNNRAVSYLTALDGGLRILYLESNLLGPEQQILRRSLASFPDIQLDYQPIDVRQRSHWPVQLHESLSLQDYDVFLIGDVDSSALAPETLTQIASLVAQGRGLMMTGGLHAFGPGGYQQTPLADLLPVEMSRFERQPLDPQAPVREDLHLPGPIRMVPAQRHFTLQLAAGDDNDSLWKSLPPLTGANRFARIKPRAAVLARAETGEPLLIAWQFDRGRVLAFAGDSTHRWWRHGFQEAHRRFWRQTMLWLAGKDQLARRDVWIQLSRRRFRPGEEIRFSAGVRNQTGEPVKEARLVAELITPDGKTRQVNLSPEGDQWTGQLVELPAAGEYQLQVTGRLADEVLGSAKASFLVEDRDLELSDPAANPLAMRRWAEMTSTWGGQSLPPEALPETLEDLVGRWESEEIRIESKWRFGDTALDTWTFFLLFVTLISSEWYLRRKWGLP